MDPNPTMQSVSDTPVVVSTSVCCAAAPRAIATTRTTAPRIVCLVIVILLMPRGRARSAPRRDWRTNVLRDDDLGEKSRAWAVCSTHTATCPTDVPSVPARAPPDPPDPPDPDLPDLLVPLEPGRHRHVGRRDVA